MQDSLVVLDASGNGMGGTEIERILDLHRLETLNLADNEINEMAQVRSCKMLTVLPSAYPRMKRAH